LFADCQTLFIEPALCQLVLYRFALFQNDETEAKLEHRTRELEQEQKVVEFLQNHIKQKKER